MNPLKYRPTALTLLDVAEEIFTRADKIYAEGWDKIHSQDVQGFDLETLADLWSDSYVAKKYLARARKALHYGGFFKEFRGLLEGLERIASTADEIAPGACLRQFLNDNILHY